MVDRLGSGSRDRRPPLGGPFGFRDIFDFFEFETEAEAEAAAAEDEAEEE
jgi:hypothetical protein